VGERAVGRGGLLAQPRGDGAAVVVPVPGTAPTLEQLTAWCETRGLARFKWPERLELLDELPLLGSGKADRAELRRRLGG